MDLQTTDKNLGAGMSVLGAPKTRIRTDGTIRPGIKILTATAKAHPKAQAIYDAGVKAGQTFKQIEKKLMDECKFEKSPLAPKNVQYFTVRRSDFSTPEFADLIMAKYATDGPAGRQLYRFPVILPTDDWLQCAPHGLHCYTRSELVYWSEFGTDGKRYCKTRAPVAVNEQTKRIARPFGGRPVVLRQENGGVCDPHKCPEYQSEQCNLTGEFAFYVYGIPGGSAIALPHRSYYTLEWSRETLERVYKLFNGKISGLFDDKPIFYVTKRLDEISMLDRTTGKPKKVRQWLIHLESAIDMTRVFQSRDALTVLPAGEAAAAALEHLPDPDETGEEAAAVVAEPEAKPVEQPVAKTDDREKVKTARREVMDLFDTTGIEPGTFDLYAKRVFGNEWSKNLETLDKAILDIKAGRDSDIDEYISRLKDPF